MGVYRGYGSSSNSGDPYIPAEGVSTFEEFGAIGDGVADDTDAVEDALIAAGAAGTIITGPSDAVYRLTRSITVPTGLLTIGKYKFKQSGDHDGLIIDPTRSLAAATVSSVTSVTYPAATGIEQTTALVVADATGFAANDLCLLYSADTYAFDANVRRGELVKINEITGTTINLVGNVVDTYSTTVRLLKLNPDRVVIDGPTFTYDGDSEAVASTVTRLGALTLIGCVDAVVNATFENDISAGVQLFSCWQPKVDITAKNLRNNGSLGMYGYGVASYSATAFGRVKIVADNVRHAYTDGTWQTSSVFIRMGRNRDMVIHDGLAANTSFASWDTHPGALNTTFNNCGSVYNITDTDQNTKNNSYSFQDRGVNTKFVDCWSRGTRVPFYFGSLLVDHGTIQNRAQIIGGHFKRFGTTTSTTLAGVPAQTSPDTVSVEIQNAVFDGFMPLQSAQASNILYFTNCEFIADGTYGMALTNSTGPMAFYGCTFREMSQLRCGQNNNMTFIGCRRINSGSSVEALILGVGSTSTIADYYAEASSFGSSRIIQGGQGSDAGTVTLNLGNVTAKGGLVAPVVSNGTATLTINYSAYDKHGDGAAATPSITFGNDPDTGWYSGGANVLSAATGGSNRVNINSSGLGYGMTPAVAFDANHASDTRYRMSVNGTVQAQFQATGSLVRVASTGTLPLYLSTNGTDRCAIDSGGLWAIGGTTTNSGIRLTINGTLYCDTDIRIGTTTSTGVATNTAPLIAGVVKNSSGTVATTTAVAANAVILPDVPYSTWIVTCSVADVDDSGNYNEVALITTNSSVATLATLINGGLIGIAMSGLNVQVTQTSGSNQTVSWTAIRIA